MFKLTPDPTFAAAVPITVPGMPAPLELPVVFRHKNRTAYNAWVDGFKDKADAAILHESSGELVQRAGRSGARSALQPVCAYQLARQLRSSHRRVVQRVQTRTHRKSRKKLTQAVDALVNGSDDPATTTDALAAFGLKPAEPLQRIELAIWPENWAPLQVFCRMESQKNIAPNGVVLGIHYAPLPFVMRPAARPQSDWPDVMDCFQIMEAHMVQLLLRKHHA